MIDPMQERQDDYLTDLDAADEWAAQDAQLREWARIDYERRRAEQDALAALWAKMQAEADAVNAEAQAIMAERGW